MKWVRPGGRLSDNEYEEVLPSGDFRITIVWQVVQLVGLVPTSSISLLEFYNPGDFEGAEGSSYAELA
jgi:hypothetical protein